MRTLFFLLFLISTSALASHKVIDKFDESFYYPDSAGVKDLFVEIRIEGLVERLKQSLLFGKLENVYFEIYLLSDGRKGVEIIGMPPGFNEIKNKLKLEALSYAEFIFPATRKQYFDGYSISKRNDGYVAEDKSGKKNILKYLLYFDANGQISRVIFNTPQGNVERNYDYTTRRDIKGKLLISKLSTKTKIMSASVLISNSIDYQKINKFILPSAITVKKMIKDVGDSEDQSNSFKVNFENYSLNEGRAMKWFLKQPKKN